MKDAKTETDVKTEKGAKTDAKTDAKASEETKGLDQLILGVPKAREVIRQLLTLPDERLAGCTLMATLCGMSLKARSDGRSKDAEALAKLLYGIVGAIYHHGEKVGEILEWLEQEPEAAASAAASAADAPEPLSN